MCSSPEPIPAVDTDAAARTIETNEAVAIIEQCSGSVALQKLRSTWALSWPLAVGLVVFVCVDGRRLLGDPDSHWHVAVGNWILEHGAVPRVDTFSFTFAGHPWIAKEWLSQVLLAVSYNLGGWGAVTALCAGAIGVTFALLLRLLLRDIKPVPAILFTVAAILMTAPHLLARPHVLAFPFMLLWVAGLIRAVEGRRAPEPLLLLAMLFWANLHGGFTLGLMLCGAFALDAINGARDPAERKTLIVQWTTFGAAAGLVSCITPYGPESILITFRIFGLGEALGLISEWKAPDFQSQPLEELILLMALFAALSSGLKLPLLRLLIVIGLVHLYLRYTRNAELLAMLVPLAIAPLLARQWPSLRFDPDSGRGSALARGLSRLTRPAGYAATLLCLALAAVFAASMIRFGSIKPPAATMPSAAFAYIRAASIKGLVFNDYDFGGFLISAGIPTFIDGRSDQLFDGGFLKRYVEALNVRGDEPLEQLLDRYQIDWTFLAKDRPANKLLARLPGWRRAYSDDTATIFMRDR
jgi:hypothetical protein